MLENILLGIQGACTVMNLLYMVAGLVIGIIFGALPGFSATMGVAVFVPFSYVMEPGAALLFLSGIYCGGVYGGSIPAVLIGIPGTSASVPTAFEGRALVRKGEGGHALGIVTFASAFGGFWSSVSLLFFAPLLALIALRVGPPETMMIAIFGLSVVCMLSEGNMLKGLFVGCITLVIASVGQDPVLGFPRFTFGQHELLGGFEVVSVLIGLFSIPEVFKMIKNLDDKDEVSKIANMRVDLKDFTGHIGNYIRSTIIGIIIGVIPAAGPDIAAFLSYNEARKVSRHKEEFGNGSIEGIIASEAANNGVTGGSLIPLLTLSIPGSAPAAIFLGAMIIHGLRPGPQLFTVHAETTYTLLIGFAIINVLLFFVGWIFCRFAGKILKIPKQILATLIMGLCTVGAFAISQNITDVIVMYIAGIFGYFLDKYDFPLSPIALGLLLGPMLEEAIMQTGTMFRNNYFMIFTRPIVDVFVFLILISFLWPVFIKRVKKRAEAEQ